MPSKNTRIRPFFFLALAVSVCLAATAAEKPGVTESKAKPEGLSEKIAATLNPAGYHVDGPDDLAADFWLVKDVAVKPDFKSTLSIKYPFTPGQLVGALQVPEKSEMKDFRGQTLKPGVYTLRYGQQPVDGNHLGTSATSDFLLALPAKIDTDPKPVAGPDQLSQSSAKAAGSTHPAIFSMLPAGKPVDKPALDHEEMDDHWIVNMTVDAKAKDKAMKLPLRFVIFGQALE